MDRSFDSLWQESVCMHRRDRTPFKTKLFRSIKNVIFVNKKREVVDIK